MFWLAFFIRRQVTIAVVVLPLPDVLLHIRRHYRHMSRQVIIHLLRLSSRHIATPRLLDAGELHCLNILMDENTPLRRLRVTPFFSASYTITTPLFLLPMTLC
jgi:hypothetical protein